MLCILTAGVPEDLAAWLESRLATVAVRAVQRGAEALDALDGGDWSALVVDERIAEPAGVEVLLAIRGREHLAPLPIVYCLGPRVEQGDLAALVRWLGVHQVIFSPVDREELARQVAGVLNLALPDPPATEDEKRASALTAVAALWERFKPANLERVAALDRAIAALRLGTLAGETRRQAQRDAHKLAGALGTFGFFRASVLARKIELTLGSDADLGPSDVGKLSRQVATLRAELAEPRRRGAVGREPAEGPVDRRPRFLIVDADPAFAERVAAEGAARGMSATTAPGPRAALDFLARERPDVVLLDLSAAENVEDSLALLTNFQRHAPPVPVLVLTARDRFIDRVEAAQQGARGFLQKPLAPPQILDAVCQLQHRLQAGESKILAVDDDPAILAILRSVLAPRGLHVTTLDDSLRFWDVLEEVAPDLVVLDVDMPRVSGVELCQVVRADARWGGLPIVFLTAHSDAETVVRLFTAGADDYVRKPVVGAELLTRILNRLERSRLLRVMAETDALSGVANRWKSTQQIDHYLRLSQRYGQPFSLAVVDLDHFKQVNDRHGHGSGDEVLRRVGQLLQRFFRCDDVVGRWGGEEFVVGMYGMSHGDAVQRLTRVLESLHQERFAGPSGEEFTVSFSAGVAQYPDDGAEVQALYLAADRALYDAKAAGRSQVRRVPAHQEGAPRPEETGRVRQSRVDGSSKR